MSNSKVTNESLVTIKQAEVLSLPTRVEQGSAEESRVKYTCLSSIYGYDFQMKFIQYSVYNDFGCLLTLRKVSRFYCQEIDKTCVKQLAADCKRLEQRPNNEFSYWLRDDFQLQFLLTLYFCAVRYLKQNLEDELLGVFIPECEKYKTLFESHLRKFKFSCLIPGDFCYDHKLGEFSFEVNDSFWNLMIINKKFAPSAYLVTVYLLKCLESSEFMSNAQKDEMEGIAIFLKKYKSFNSIPFIIERFRHTFTVCLQAESVEIKYNALVGFWAFITHNLIDPFSIKELIQKARNIIAAEVNSSVPNKTILPAAALLLFSGLVEKGLITDSIVGELMAMAIYLSRHPESKVHENGLLFLVRLVQNNFFAPLFVELNKLLPMTISFLTHSDYNVQFNALLLFTELTERGFKDQCLISDTFMKGIKNDQITNVANILKSKDKKLQNSIVYLKKSFLNKFNLSLQSESPEIQYNALCGFVSFSKDYLMDVVLVKDFELIQKMIELISSTVNEKSKIEALLLLEQLAKQGLIEAQLDTRRKLMQIAINFLKHPRLSVKKQTLVLLTRFTEKGLINALLAKECNLVQIVIPFLKHSRLVVKIEALTLLAKFTEKDLIDALLIKECNLVQTIIAFVTHNQWEVQSYTFLLFAELTKKGYLDASLAHQIMQSALLFIHTCTVRNMPYLMYRDPNNVLLLLRQFAEKGLMDDLLAKEILMQDVIPFLNYYFEDYRKNTLLLLMNLVGRNRINLSLGTKDMLIRLADERFAYSLVSNSDNEIDSYDTEIDSDEDEIDSDEESHYQAQDYFEDCEVFAGALLSFIVEPEELFSRMSLDVFKSYVHPIIRMKDLSVETIEILLKSFTPFLQHPDQMMKEIAALIIYLLNSKLA